MGPLCRPEGYELQYVEQPGQWVRFDERTVEYLQGPALMLFRALCLKYHDEQKAKEVFAAEWLPTFATIS